METQEGGTRIILITIITAVFLAFNWIQWIQYESLLTNILLPPVLFSLTAMLLISAELLIENILFSIYVFMFTQKTTAEE